MILCLNVSRRNDLNHRLRNRGWLGCADHIGNSTSCGGRLKHVPPAYSMKRIRSCVVWREWQRTRSPGIRTQKQLGLLSMWSFTRDRANAKGTLSYAEGNSSSLVQEPFGFSQFFGQWMPAAGTSRRNSRRRANSGIQVFDRLPQIPPQQLTTNLPRQDVVGQRLPSWPAVE